MIELVIKANRPELSDSSLKQYLSSLRTLNDKKPIQDIDFLKDYDTVMEKLSSKKPTTVKNYMNAIIVKEEGSSVSHRVGVCFWRALAS